MDSYSFTITVLILKLNLIQNLKLNQTVLIDNYGYARTSTTIALYSQDIESIDANTFIGFNQLETLYLQSNKINKLDSFQRSNQFKSAVA